MKKIFNWLLLPLMMLLGACAQEEIVFDHEKPAFETKEGMILLEVIVPTSTKADDVIYISGAFNGGDEAAAGDVTWQLEKSTTIDKKWGIYLDPSTFVEGKTLADGYRFISVREGEERTAKNEAVNRTENPAPGTRTNIYVSFWNMFFYVAPEIEHDGPVLYVDNKTSWDALALYAWGDAEAFGGWPGMQPTGEVVLDGTTWTYFDLGEANRGLNLNLIFNNNGGGSQLADYNVTLDKDEYFLVITDEGVEAANSIPSHEGTIRVYVDNQAGWEAVALYQWGDVNDLGGGWPGVQPAGTAKIAGVEYTYFEYAVADVDGLAQNLIFNNNGGGIQTGDMAVTFSADVPDHFYLIYGEKDCMVIEDPFNREPIGGGDEGGSGNEGGGDGDVSAASSFLVSAGAAGAAVLLGWALYVNAFVKHKNEIKDNVNRCAVYEKINSDQYAGPNAMDMIRMEKSSTWYLGYRLALAGLIIAAAAVGWVAAWIISGEYEITVVEDCIAAAAGAIIGGFVEILKEKRNGK